MKKQKKKHLLHLLNLKKQGAFFSFLAPSFLGVALFVLIPFWDVVKLSLIHI